MDVLEVGSGSWGLAEFVDFAVIGCDVEFGDQTSERLRPVVGSAMDLPFADRQFECVVCLDTLEHLPPHGRREAVRELARVADKYLIVGCPMGNGAQTIDRFLYQNFRARGNEAPVWLREHMQYPFPRREDVTRVLDAEGFLYRAVNSESIWVHYLLMCGEAVPGPANVLNSLSDKAFVRHFMPSMAIGRAYRTLFFAERAGPLGDNAR